jgi:hypothetical protein
VGVDGEESMGFCKAGCSFLYIVSSFPPGWWWLKFDCQKGSALPISERSSVAESSNPSYEWKTLIIICQHKLTSASVDRRLVVRPGIILRHVMNGLILTSSEAHIIVMHRSFLFCGLTVASLSSHCIYFTDVL